MDSKKHLYPNVKNIVSEMVLQYMKGAIECSQACEGSSSNFGDKGIVMSLECTMEIKWSYYFYNHVTFKGNFMQVIEQVSYGNSMGVQCI